MTRYLTTAQAARLLGLTPGQLDDHLFRGLSGYAPMRPQRVGQQLVWVERQLIAYRAHGLSKWPHPRKSERVYGAADLCRLVSVFTGLPYSLAQLRFAVASGRLAGLIVGRTRIFPYPAARAWIRSAGFRTRRFGR